MRYLRVSGARDGTLERPGDGGAPDASELFAGIREPVLEDVTLPTQSLAHPPMLRAVDERGEELRLDLQRVFPNGADGFFERTLLVVRHDAHGLLGGASGSSLGFILVAHDDERVVARLQVPVQTPPRRARSHVPAVLLVRVLVAEVIVAFFVAAPRARRLCQRRRPVRLE